MNRSAFTLVEVVVAAALTAVLAGIVVSSLSSVSQGGGREMATQRASAEVDRTLVLMQDRIAVSSAAQVSSLTGGRGVLHLTVGGYEIYCLDDGVGIVKKFTASGRGSGQVTGCTQAGVAVGYTGVSTGSSVTSPDLVATTWQAELLQTGSQSLVKVTLGLRSGGEVRVSRPATPVVGSAVATVGRDAASFSATSTSSAATSTTTTATTPSTAVIISGAGGTFQEVEPIPDDPFTSMTSVGSISSGPAIGVQQLD